MKKIIQFNPEGENSGPGKFMPSVPGSEKFQDNVSEQQRRTETDVTGSPDKSKEKLPGENAIKSPEPQQDNETSQAELQQRNPPPPPPAPESPAIDVNADGYVKSEKEASSELASVKPEPPVPEKILPYGIPKKGTTAWEEFAAGIAMVCYEANVAFSAMYGQYTQVPWSKSEIWHKQIAIDSVKFRLENPEATPVDQHERWRKDKLENGWVYGPVRNEVKKTHPLLVDYNVLPEFERRKSLLLMAIVDILSGKVHF